MIRVLFKQQTDRWFDVIVLIQRVSRGEVVIDEKTVASIRRGLVCLVGFEKGDGDDQLRRMAERLTRYRVFADPAGKMNLAVGDVAGELLLVPQFTLAADTDSGNRPSFTPAAPPERGETLFATFVDTVRRIHPATESGRFGAEMQVTLTNDGPVTFRLRVPPVKGQ